MKSISNLAVDVQATTEDTDYFNNHVSRTTISTSYHPDSQKAAGMDENLLHCDFDYDEDDDLDDLESHQIYHQIFGILSALD